MTNSLGKKLPWGKWTALFILGTLILFVIYVLSIGLNGFIYNPLYQYLVHIGGIALLLFTYHRLTAVYERRKVLELRPKRRAIFEGLILAIILFGIYTSLSLIFGGGSIAYNGLTYEEALSMLVNCLVIAIGEEIVFRGMIFRMLYNQVGMLTAIIVSSLIFGFGHAFNPGASILSSLTIAVSAGIVMGLLLVRFRSLWAPIAFHFAWNFIEGPVLGTEVSGMTSPSLFKLAGMPKNMIWGDQFGPESSVIILVLGILVSLYYTYQIYCRQADLR